MKSSLGFHTLTVTCKISTQNARKLREDFKKYSEVTGAIRIFIGKSNRHHDKIKINTDGTVESTTIYDEQLEIRYTKENKGITWTIRYDNFSGKFKMFIIEAKINPKILSGIHDYVTAATDADMEIAIRNFNAECARISVLLGQFENYNLQRVDYCVNFFIPELAPGCTPDQIMKLIKRGNIPDNYREWTQYDAVSHRKLSKPSSFYLMSKSVNINCYSKYLQLIEESNERTEKGLSPISQDIIDSAYGIIRFEVQCKYKKMYNLATKWLQSGILRKELHTSLLSDDFCRNIINHYYSKIFTRGNWYTLRTAENMVLNYNYNNQKEDRILATLDFVNRCRSIAKARAECDNENMKKLKTSLNDLSAIGINPVTIPREWNIKYIQNLLQAYFDKEGYENFNKLYQLIY